MEDVELIEFDASGAVPDDEEPRRSGARLRPQLRRLLRRWWPAAVVVLLAVVGTTVVLDARRSAALARVRELPGVLTATVEPPLEAAEWGTLETAGALYGSVRTADGLLVGPTWPLPGEPAAVVALDRESGAEQWRVDVEDVPDGPSAGLECDGDAEPAATAWCLLSDGAGRRMVAVDLVRRVVASTHPLPDGTDATVRGDTLFVAQSVADGVEVVASDLPDGTQRWLTRVPSPAVDDASPPWLWVNGSHLWVLTAAGQWSLDPADGAVEAAATSIGVTRGDRLVATPGSAGTRLLGRDGSESVDLPGMPLDVRPDDGSAPDVLVLSGDDAATPVIRGVSVRTGEQLWQRPATTEGWAQVVLLDGVVYGAGRGTVWAVDAQSGHELWSTETGANREQSLVTDGVHLLQVETRTEGRELAAYGLRDGLRAWSAPLPEDVDWVSEIGGLLVATSDTGPLRVLR
jgi:outer membrane protein assembly factor BamB